MERLFLAIACTLLHIPPAFIRYAPFKELVTPQRKRILIPLYVLILLLAGVSYYIFGKSHTILTHKLVLLGIAVILSGVNVLVIPGHWREHLFTTGLSSVHMSVTYFSCVYLVMHFVSITDPIRMVACSALMTFIVFLLLFRYYVNSARRVVTPFLKMESGDYWTRIWFIPLPLFFASFLSAPLDSYDQAPSALICRLLILAATIMMSNAISEDHGNMRSRLEMAEQLNMQMEYYHGMTERLDEARKSRHDFKHHLAAIRRYIDNNDKSGLTQYWEDLQEIVSNENDIPYTGNAALDGVLYRYASLAKQHGIKFGFSGIIEKLELPDTALSVLLGNALDNALAGCMTLETGRFISVDMRVDLDEQSILIRNSFDGNVDISDNKILSRKRDGKPGIGLESMASICEKHGCLMDIRHDENTFSVLLLLKIKR